jgi:hypothetical protein
MSPSIRRTSLRFSALALALACLAATQTAAAQSPAPLAQPTSVPIELVSALVVTGGLGGAEEPRVLVGSAPEWILPKIVLPPGARILGAAFQGTTVLAIVNMPGAGDSIIPQLKAQLLARGWKPQPASPGSMGGGFRPALAPAADVAPTRVTVCDMPQALTASVARRDAQSADIAYRITTLPSGYSICNLPQNNGLPGYKSPFPTLYNPPASADARMSGDCQTPMIGSQGTNTTLRTAMAPDLILDHYAKQLTDSGWTAAPASATVTRTFSRTEGGSAAELSLTVSASARDQSCHEIGMNVKTLRRP